MAASLIRQLTLDQEKHFERLGLEPATLYGRRLHQIDVQNLLCELDKSTRISHPELNNGRTKMKRKFDPSKAQPLPELVLPPKWQIKVPSVQVAGPTV